MRECKNLKEVEHYVLKLKTAAKVTVTATCYKCKKEFKETFTFKNALITSKKYNVHCPYCFAVNVLSIPVC